MQERLRYVPLGWAKYYEFNESDLRVACDTLDTWIDTTAMVKSFIWGNILNIYYNSLIYCILKYIFICSFQLSTFDWEKIKECH